MAMLVKGNCSSEVGWTWTYCSDTTYHFLYKPKTQVDVHVNGIMNQKVAQFFYASKIIKGNYSLSYSTGSQGVISSSWSAKDSFLWSVRLFFILKDSKSVQLNIVILDKDWYHNEGIPTFNWGNYYYVLQLDSYLGICYCLYYQLQDYV